MRTRLEVRNGRRSPTHDPRRFPRAVYDHVRALLISHDGRRVTLASVRMPLTDTGRVAELVEKVTPKLREHVTDNTLYNSMMKTLRLQAKTFIESPDRQAARHAREAAPFAKIREVGARKRAEQAVGLKYPGDESPEESEPAGNEGGAHDDEEDD